jgi:hypothetical protein
MLLCFVSSAFIRKTIEKTSNIRYLSHLFISEESNNLLWEKQWKTIEEIRKIQSKNEISAPIDTMGADALAHYNSSLSNSDISFRFQTLIATMLSPQTRLQLHFTILSSNSFTAKNF